MRWLRCWRLCFDTIGWQGLFVVGGVLPLIVAGLLAVNLKETRVRLRKTARQSAPRYMDNLFGRGQALRTVLLWVVFALTLLRLLVAQLACRRW